MQLHHLELVNPPELQSSVASCATTSCQSFQDDVFSSTLVPFVPLRTQITCQRTNSSPLLQSSPCHVLPRNAPFRFLSNQFRSLFSPRPGSPRSGHQSSIVGLANHHSSTRIIPQIVQRTPPSPPHNLSDLPPCLHFPQHCSG